DGKRITLWRDRLSSPPIRRELRNTANSRPAWCAVGPAQAAAREAHGPATCRSSGRSIAGMSSPTASVFVAACVIGPLAAQTENGPKDLTAHFDVQDNIAVELWAESPDLFNPTAIDIDAKGRVFVSEAVNYRQWEGRNPGLKRPEGDRIVVLEDTDGDGKC